MENKIFKSFIHPFLFGIYPILFLYLHNIYETQLSQLFEPLIIILTVTFVLIISLRYLLKNNDKTGVIISFFYILFFSYGSIFSLVSKLDDGLDIDIIFFFVELIFLATGVFYILRSKSNFRIIVGFLNVFSIALISFSLFNFTLFALTRSDDTEIFTSINQLKIPDNLDPEELPDIYHIILDAYGRNDVLKDLYKYDNSDFTDFLESKGFYVASMSVANYSRTTLSLGSMLNLDYIDNFLQGITANSKDKSWWKYPIRDFLFFNFIKKYGYKIFAISSGYKHTELIRADEYLYSRFIKQGYKKDFENLLFNTTLFVPVVARWYRFYDPYTHRRNRILGSFEILKNMPEFTSPTYIFAHILSPHVPVIFDENGNPIDDHRSVTSREEYYEEYGNQITYLNSEIKEIINSILANPQRPTIIIIQGDHGLRSHMYWEEIEKNTNFKESLSILNAFYFHDGNYEQLYDNISPVNSFRVIFNQYMGMDFELLDDRSYLFVGPNPYDFIEYTEKDSITSSN